MAKVLVAAAPAVEVEGFRQAKAALRRGAAERCREAIATAVWCRGSLSLLILSRDGMELAEGDDDADKE